MPTIFDASALTPADFLRDFWQRKPLLLRQAFPGFTPELDADDIAGLACDEMAELRLVTGSYAANDWSVRYGPFSEADFAALPERDCTLLVQDVEKHYPPLQGLLAAFGFLPRWRIDDLMVSVAAPGGSVGPHVDQYDVFLLQAAGTRRWQIAQRFDPQLEADCELNVLRRFQAEQEWTLEAGDLLYLPPGVAHFGIADLGAAPGSPPCMTWSIGMRAPSAADLFQSFGEWLADREDQGGRYRDPGLAPARWSGEIDADALARLRALARECVDDDERWHAFLGAFLSRHRLPQEPAPPPRLPDAEQLRQALESGATLRHNPWTRLLWLHSGNGALLFAAGDSFDCEPGLAQLLCDPHALGAAPARQFFGHFGLLCELLARGHLWLEAV
jgi:50S ribosomal protein L16 3-hydroxylase